MSLSERIIAVVDQAGFSNGLKYYLKTELNKTKNFTINNENDIPLETRQRIAKLLSAKWNKTKITSLSVLVEEALKINIEADSGVVSEVEQVVSEKNPINLQQEIVESKTEESPSIAETDAVQKNPNTPIINISNMQ